jgi:hypothetical protein
MVSSWDSLAGRLAQAQNGWKAVPRRSLAGSRIARETLLVGNLLSIGLAPVAPTSCGQTIFRNGMVVNEILGRHCAAENLPMNQIYQCSEKDLSKLCIRELSAGEENGSVGYRPPSWFQQIRWLGITEVER